MPAPFSKKFVEGFPSGQRDQTVNLTAQPSQVRILPPPPFFLQTPGSLSKICGCRIMAITSAFQADDAGSIPATRSKNKILADIAQSVERTLGKGEVGGSNPPISTIYSYLRFFFPKFCIKYKTYYLNLSTGEYRHRAY